MSWWSRLANVFRPDRVNRDLDDELRFHLEERTRELIAGGMSGEAAGKAATRRLGNPLRLREESRDVKLMPWLDSLVRDVRLGVRMLRKNATVTGAAVISLALALGACVAAFSLVDALILRPLPVERPGQLIYLAFPTYIPERPESDTFSDPLFVRLRDASRARVDLFAMSTQVMRPAIFERDGEKEQVRTQFVSGDAFDRLGVRAARGRLLAPHDDVPPGALVAVVSHAFWLRRFGGDPSIIGRTCALEGRQLQIVGVAEPRFAGIDPGRPTDLWLPYASYNPRAFGNAAFNWFRILGRVKDSLGPDAAQIALQTTFSNFRRDNAAAMSGRIGAPENLARLVSTPLYVRSAANGLSPLRRQFERSLWILATIAGLVLLIAGSNVGNLFFARAAVREREMALRLSIGAGRGRLIQQVLIESAIVAAAACVLGLLFAAVAAPSVVGALAASDDPVQLDLRLDWRLVAFSASLTLLTTALFGVAPALRASRVAPMTTLKTGDGRAGIRTGMMRPFVALQVAFGLVVLFVGGLLVLSFARLSGVDPGFATSNVLLLNVETTRRVDVRQQRTALLGVVDRLRLMPGVQTAGAAEFNTLGRAWTYFVPVPGTPHQEIEATMAPVTEGFFETMKIPVLSGRAFERRDIDIDRSTAVVVNETFATRYFGRQQAVGRVFAGRFGESDAAERHEVIGVVADTRYDLRRPAAPTIYFPLRTSGTIHVRVAGDPSGFAVRFREDIRATDPLFRVSSVTLQSAVVDQTLLRERLLATLAGFFSVVGLVLVAVGLYGVLSYSVVHRTREIGIRLALGARPLGIVRTVLADTGGAVLAGAVCGLAGGVYLSRFVEALLFEVTPRDFLSMALPLVTLLLAASLSAVLPAFRAARVEPVIALRYE